MHCRSAWCCQRSRNSWGSVRARDSPDCTNGLTSSPCEDHRLIQPVLLCRQHIPGFCRGRGRCAGQHLLNSARNKGQDPGGDREHVRRRWQGRVTPTVTKLATHAADQKSQSQPSACPSCRTSSAAASWLPTEQVWCTARRLDRRAWPNFIAMHHDPRLMPSVISPGHLQLLPSSDLHGCNTRTNKARQQVTSAHNRRATLCPGGHFAVAENRLTAKTTVWRGPALQSHNDRQQLSGRNQLTIVSRGIRFPRD